MGGVVRPMAGFALRLEHLPGLASKQGRNTDAFTPLQQPGLGLYAIVDSAAWVERVLAAGVRTVQLRIKEAQHPQLSSEIRRSVAAARAVNAQLFINDHWALAIEHGADDAVPQPDIGIMFAAAGSADKQMRVIAGANHYFQGQPEQLQQGVALVSGWTRERFG